MKFHGKPKQHDGESAFKSVVSSLWVWEGQIQDVNLNFFSQQK